MNDVISIYKGSDKFSEYLKTYAFKEKIKYELNSKDVSKAIYVHLVKMRLASWKHDIEFNRRVSASFADIFQDVIAFYLNVCLPENFKVVLEERKNKLQPDILIYKNKEPYFILEIKTTIGWNRKSIANPNDKDNPMVVRINSLSETFNIPKENIIYIFESPFNVNNSFSDRYWNKKERKAKPEPTEFPFSQIKPLFASSDPFYWKHEEGFNRDENYKELTEESIWKVAENEIVTSFENILAKIQK